MEESNLQKSVPYRRLAAQAIFLILAVALHILEDHLPLPTLLPGFRLGLSNLITMIVLTQLGPADAIPILLIRIALTSLLSGSGTYALYSFVGGIPAILIIYLLYAYMDARYYYIPLLSATAAAIHISCQCALFYSIGIHQIGNIYAYLLLFSIISGFLLGMCSLLVYKPLRRLFIKLDIPFRKAI